MPDRLSSDRVNELAKQIPAWKCKGDSLERDFALGDFQHAISFVNQVAELAQSEGHHPDIHVSYDHVRLELSTHKAGGLTDRDFVLANKIDSLRS